MEVEPTLTLPTGRRNLVLVVVCVAQLMITLDTTIVNVALPSIGDSLHRSQASLTWVIDGFLLTFGGLLLLAGRLGDLVGHRRVLLGGLTIFTVASLACGIAPDATVLIAARFLQGVGAALQAAVVLAIIAREFPEPADRARAMSAYVFVAVSGGSLGLLVGGVLTEGLSWRWIFLVNLPIGVLALLGTRLLVPADGPPRPLRRVDPLGSLLVTAGMVALVYAIVEAGSQGWGSTATLTAGALAVALFGGLVLWERRVAEPILPGRILRSRGLLASSLLRGAISTAMYGTFFLGSLFAERVLGYGALATGLAFLPWTVTLGLLSVGVTQRVVGRLGPRPTMFGGLLFSVIGLLLLTQTTAESSYLPLFACAYVLIGAGAGLSLSPMIMVAMADVAPEDHGLGSAVTTISQQIGGALGLAILSTLATERTSALRSGGVSIADALVGGYHLAYLVGAAIVVASVAVAVLVLLGRPRGSTRPSPDDLDSPATP